jgi:hypothetical protein
MLCAPFLKSLWTQQQQRTFWFVKSVKFLDELSYFLIFNDITPWDQWKLRYMKENY